MTAHWCSEGILSSKADWLLESELEALLGKGSRKKQEELSGYRYCTLCTGNLRKRYCLHKEDCKKI